MCASVDQRGRTAVCVLTGPFQNKPLRNGDRDPCLIPRHLSARPVHKRVLPSHQQWVAKYEAKPAANCKAFDNFLRDTSRREETPQLPVDLHKAAKCLALPRQA